MHESLIIKIYLNILFKSDLPIPFIHEVLYMNA